MGWPFGTNIVALISAAEPWTRLPLSSQSSQAGKQSLPEQSSGAAACLSQPRCHCAQLPHYTPQWVVGYCKLLSLKRFQCTSVPCTHTHAIATLHVLYKYVEQCPSKTQLGHTETEIPNPAPTHASEFGVKSFYAKEAGCGRFKINIKQRLQHDFKTENRMFF